MSDILAKLQAAAAIYTDRELPNSIMITKNAYAKTRRFGELLDEKAGSSYEWYTFPLAINGQEYIIRDIIFPKAQKISHAHVGVTGADVAAVSAEVSQLNKKNNTDYYVIGWVHSHADFSPFHSGTDTNNIMDVLNSVSLNTEFVKYRDFKFINSQPQREQKDSGLLIKGQYAEDAKITLDYDPNVVLDLIKKAGLEKDADKLKDLIKNVLMTTNMKFQEPVITGFCYSIVVNNIKAPPDTLMAIIDEEMLTGKKSQYTKKVPLKIMEVENDITYTDDELNKIIEERVEIPKTFLQTIFGGKEDKDEYKKDKHKKDDDKKEDHSKYQPKGKSLEVKVESAAAPKGRQKISDAKLIDDFCDTLWRDAYEIYGSTDYKMDVIIATILGNKNIEAVNDINDAEFRKQHYSSIKFIPSIALERREEFKEIITGYVKKGNTKLLDFMFEYIDVGQKYMRREKIFKIGNIFDENDIKNLLVDNTKKDNIGTVVNNTNSVEIVDKKDMTFVDTRNIGLEDWERLYKDEPKTPDNTTEKKDEEKKDNKENDDKKDNVVI